MLVEHVDWDRPKVFDVSREAVCTIFKEHRGFVNNDWYHVNRLIKLAFDGTTRDVVISQRDDVLAIRVHPPVSLIERGYEDHELTRNELRAPYIKVEVASFPDPLFNYYYNQELARVSSLIADMSGFYHLGLNKEEEFRLTFPKEYFANNVVELDAILID